MQYEKIFVVLGRYELNFRTKRTKRGFLESWIRQRSLSTFFHGDVSLDVQICFLPLYLLGLLVFWILLDEQKQGVIHKIMLAQEKNIDLNQQKQFQTIFLPKKKEGVVLPRLFHIKQVHVF